ncbi:unnamed protein product [Linum tenue]|uniref:Uncharacterized protein n=1 Tax=Linum tenue TaxID=586396 RepID=A0AAV0RVF1_9ROSI|nr:unnamed protein product [Linum tenue]
MLGWVILGWLLGVALVMVIGLDQPHLLEQWGILILVMSHQII